MLPDKIMQSDLLDILFENRNKNYGAYALRRSYDNVLKVSITVTVFISACFTYFISAHKLTQRDYVKTFIIPPDISLSKFKPDAQKPSSALHVKTLKNIRQVNTSTPIITNENIKTTQPTVDEIDKSIVSAVNAKGDMPEGNINAPEGNGLNSAQPVLTTAKPVIDDNAPLVKADVMPEFPGGVNALVKFIQRNIKQPDDLQEQQQIKVIASFIVSKNGEIENVKIISSGRPDLDKEVLKVISKMPLWKPGIQNGKPAAVYFNLPVTFQSADD